MELGPIRGSEALALCLGLSLIEFSLVGLSIYKSKKETLLSLTGFLSQECPGSKGTCTCALTSSHGS